MSDDQGSESFTLEVVGGSCHHVERRLHQGEGQFVYSDGSKHICCAACTKRLRGLAHGPGKFVPFTDEQRRFAGVA